MITPKNILKHELMGLHARVASSPNIAYIGLEGTVTDESRNTLTIKTGNGEKKLVKAQCIFTFELPSGEAVKVEGRYLVSRPEDRIKKRQPKW